MTSRIAIVAIATLLAILTAASAVAAGGAEKESAAAVAKLADAQGSFLGTVRFLPRDDGKVTVRAATAWLPAGFHGFHVHAVGRCEPPFTSAGAHLDLEGGTHASHAGDMPVLYVGRDGLARMEFQTDRFTVEDLLDADGSAVIVHAGPDNYANIPSRYAPAGPDAATLATGDAGPRYACGVVARR